MTFSLA